MNLTKPLQQFIAGAVAGSIAASLVLGITFAEPWSITWLAGAFAALFLIGELLNREIQNKLGIDIRRAEVQDG